MYIYTRLPFQNDLSSPIYWVTTINRPLKKKFSFANEPLNRGLFCKRAPQKSPTKQTYIVQKKPICLKEPTKNTPLV